MTPLLCALCLGLAGLALGKDAPVVDIPDQGPVSGKEVSVTRGQKATQYLGIPFAKSPPDRLQPPVWEPLPNWTEPRNSSFMPSCLQSRKALKEYERIFSQILREQLDQLEFNEDCLYLNVYVPDGQPPPGNWPVVVWFHPGNFSVGTPTLWDGSTLAVKQRVIVVTPAYRLNIMGFFAMDGDVSPGNYGLMDQVAALKWVKAKISVFGGSPEDVCIMGHGAGGTSVGLHMVSPRSEGQFSRAIAMSGSAFDRLIDTMPSMDTYKDLYAGCERTSSQVFVDCLRNIVPDSLVEETWDRYPWGPVIDNVTKNAFLPKPPENLFETYKMNKADYMTGYVDMEDAFMIDDAVRDSEKGISADMFRTLIETETEDEYYTEVIQDLGLLNGTCGVNVPHLVDTILFYYSPYPPSVDTEVIRQKYVDYTTEKRYGSGIYKQATFISKSAARTYVYRFDYKPKKSHFTGLPDWVSVPHGFELPFFWGMPYWPSLSHLIWNGADRKVADIVMNLWTNFAKTGNPIQSGINYKWDVFKEDSPGVMIIDRNFNMSDPSTFDHKAFAFWNDYFPKVKEAMKCCNITQNAFRVHSSPALTGILATIAGLQFLLSS